MRRCESGNPEPAQDGYIGQRLSDKAVVWLVQATAEGVGAVDPDLIAGGRGLLAASLAQRYSGHSLRAGLATVAADAEA